MCSPMRLTRPEWRVFWGRRGRREKKVSWRFFFSFVPRAQVRRASRRLLKPLFSLSFVFEKSEHLKLLARWWKGEIETSDDVQTLLLDAGIGLLLLAINRLGDERACPSKLSKKKKLTGRPRKDLGFALERVHERGPYLGVALLCCGRVWKCGSGVGRRRREKESPA